MTDNDIFKGYATNVLGFDPAHVDTLMSHGLNSFEEIKNHPGNIYRSRDSGDSDSDDYDDYHDFSFRVRCLRVVEMLRYYLLYLERTSSMLTDAEIVTKATLDELKRVYEYKVDEESGKERRDFPEPYTTFKKFRVKLEEIKGWCGCTRGLDGTPLSYIIRENEEPKQYIEGKVWSVDDECVHRHPLKGTTFNYDNERVWQLVNSVYRNTEGWCYVSQFAEKQDGRGAVRFLDDIIKPSIFTEAIRTVVCTIYSGESRNSTFEQFVTNLHSAHLDLEATGQGLSQYYRIILLLQNVSDPAMEGYKGTILAYPERYDTFEKCISVLRCATLNRQIRETYTTTSNNNSDNENKRTYKRSWKNGKRRRTK